MLIKVCGTTSEEDALLAVAMGADMVGFVFAPSPRQIAPQIAADIVKRLPRETIPVGVFRDEAPERVLSIAHLAGLKAVQLHGHEKPEVSQWLRTRVPMVIQAFPAGDSRVRRAGEYGATAVLLDAPNPGSGEVFDWAMAAEVPVGQRLMIAGGLNPGNVGAAIARARPWGVDVATGVEREPGIKDPIKVREFIAAARAAEDELEREHAPLVRADASAGDGSAGDPEAEGGLYDWQDEG
jgi:phosphoribosylanthranilate isomerase